MKKIVIIGAGGHGKVVADVAESVGYSEIVFLDDDSEILECGAYRVIGTSDKAEELATQGYDVFVAVGNAENRKRLITELDKMNVECPVLIHKSAIVSKNVKIGQGTVIMPGAVINSGTVIGKGCIINTSSSLDHDNCLNNFVHVSVGVHTAGTVSIGESAWIGIGAIISNNVTICSKSLIGAGAVVIKSISEAGTYAGVPAKRIK